MAKLSERTRQHLPFLALFSERVNAHWLYQFSDSPDGSYRQAYYNKALKILEDSGDL